LAGALVGTGCATKKYVRNTTAPIQAKVDQVGEQTTKQGQAIEESKNQIKQVDEQAQSGINAAKERAMTAENRANEAMTAANQAGQAAQKNTEAVTHLRGDLQNVQSAVANLDDYKLQTEVTVPFKFDRYNLSDDAKHQLDQLASESSKDKRFFIAVEGYTDQIGTKQYNEALSRRRADAVVQYLVAQHNIAIYRIHMIGLGEQKPVEEARTRAAREKNRRVEVKLFSADQALASASRAGQ
jgi:outer membrane protein OmpA-like peptidoglycan-associated protein